MYRHIYHSFDCLFTALEKWMAPLWFLAMRLWLAQVFLKSGLVSISDWKRNVQLFLNICGTCVSSFADFGTGHTRWRPRHFSHEPCD
jgi:hypothetical protein